MPEDDYDDSACSTSLAGMTVVYVSVAGFAGVFRTLKQARTLAACGARVMLVGYRGCIPQAYLDSEVEVVQVDKATSSTSHHPIRLVRIGLNLTYFRVKNMLGRRLGHAPLVKAVVELQPDVVQVVELPGLKTAFSAAEAAGAHLIYDSNELWSGFLRNPDLNMPAKQAAQMLRDERELIGRASLVLTTSEALAERLQADYGIARPLALLNAPPNRVTTVREVGDPVRLVYHGGLSRDRNIEALVRAMQHLRDKATLDIHGFDRTTSAVALRRLVEELDLNDVVRVCGPYRYDEVVDLLAGYDVGVMAPKLVEENFLYTLPNKLFDCICAGIAVAMYDAPPVRQIIDEARCGIVLDSASPDTIAEGLAALIDDRDRLMRMKSAAVDASDRYWWPRQGARLVEAFEDTLGAN